MGTNFYFMTKNKELAHKFFDREYELTEEPYLGYEIHLNKISIGWRPLFQKHKEFDTWNKLEQFYLSHKDNLDVYDEYGGKYEWEAYKKRIFDHATREQEPMKWYYGKDPKIKHLQITRDTLYYDRCKPEEADFWIPIDHVEYTKAEREARLKFGLGMGNEWYSEIEYWNDPVYKIDWVEGDFS